MKTKRSENSPVRWNIRVPFDLASRVTKRLQRDPGSDTLYGARAALVASLLEQWLAEGAGRGVDK